MIPKAIELVKTLVVFLLLLGVALIFSCLFDVRPEDVGSWHRVTWPLRCQ